MNDSEKRLSFEDARIWVPAVALVAAVATFWPVVRNGFVNWDDRIFILDNPHLRFTWADLRWMFTASLPGDYQPLNWLSLALDRLLWGRHPFGFHLTALLLHGANSALFAVIAALIFQRTWACDADDQAPWWWGGAAALLFAVHPLRVEAVAWAADRRDPLCALFFLGAVALYLKPGKQRPVAVFLCAATAMLAKGPAVTLPLVLLILDYYPLGRFNRRAVMEKAPLFALAVPFAVVGAAAHSRSMQTVYEFGNLERLLLGCGRFWLYLWQTVWPSGLSPGGITPFHSELTDPRYGLSAAALVLTVVALARWRRPWAWAAFLYYVVTILPVLGLTRLSPQVTADRFTYLACLPLALLTAAAAASWTGAAPRSGRLAALAGAGFFIVAALCVAARLQIGYWRDAETLWTRAVAVRPDSVIARDNLAEIYLERRRFKEAYEQLRAAMSIKFDYAPTFYGAGRMYAASGSPDRAERFFRETLRRDPAHIGASNDLGLLLFGRGRPGEAAAVFKAALAARSDDEDGAAELKGNLYNNLGNALAASGEFVPAIASYDEALRRRPGDPRSVFNRALACLKAGRREEASRGFAAVLAVAPDFPGARANLEAAQAPVARSRARGSRSNR